MKRGKKLTVLIVILALMMGLYVIVTKWTAAQEEKESEASYTTVFSFDVDDVTEITWQYNVSEETDEGTETGTEQWTLKKVDGSWNYGEDEDLDLDEEAVDSMISNISALTSEQVFDIDESDDLSQYGFDEPISKITVKTESEEYTLITGDYNDVAYAYYAMIEGSNQVFITEGTYTDVFMATPESLEYTEE